MAGVTQQTGAAATTTTPTRKLATTSPEMLLIAGCCCCWRLSWTQHRRERQLSLHTSATLVAVYVREIRQHEKRICVRAGRLPTPF